MARLCDRIITQPPAAPRGSAALSPRQPRTAGRSTRALLAGVLTALITAAPATASGDTVYRWLDARGQLVVSDRPPADPAIPYEQLDARVPRRSGATSGRETDAGGPRPFPRPDADRGERSAREAPARDPRTCATARQNLQTLDTFARIRLKGDDGEFYYMTEKEKGEQREEALRQIELHCE